MVNKKMLSDNFYYFTYYVKSKQKNCASSSLKSIVPFSFLDESILVSIFKLYELFDSNELYILEDQQRNMGFTTFLTYMMYHKAYSKISVISYITDNNEIRGVMDKLLQFCIMFKPLFKLDGFYNEVKRIFKFSNGSEVKFYSDVTYGFKIDDAKNDLLIFDNATMKNFDKLISTIESIINEKFAEKAIFNFNNMPPLFKGTENFEFLKKEFKNYIKFVTVEK